MISIITCSIKDELSNQLKANIDKTIGVEYEFIRIDNKENKYSITQAYNKGAQIARFPYLCFVHEDILFHTTDWGVKLIHYLRQPEISLVGILGSLIKTKAPSGVFLPIDFFYRVNQLQRRKDNLPDHYYSNPLNEPYSEVQTLDGMFLATTMKHYLAYKFDDSLLTGFHGYDIDFSLGQSKNGKVIVVYDILIEHFSSGGNTVNWINEQLKITQKWQKELPLYITSDKRHLLNAEIINTEAFLIALHLNNYKSSIQLKYLFELVRVRPFSLKTMRFIARFLIKRKTLPKE